MNLHLPGDKHYPSLSYTPLPLCLFSRRDSIEQLCCGYILGGVCQPHWEIMYTCVCPSTLPIRSPHHKPLPLPSVCFILSMVSEARQEQAPTGTALAVTSVRRSGERAGQRTCQPCVIAQTCEGTSTPTKDSLLQALVQCCRESSFRKRARSSSTVASISALAYVCTTFPRSNHGFVPSPPRKQTLPCNEEQTHALTHARGRIQNDTSRKKARQRERAETC